MIIGGSGYLGSEIVFQAKKAKLQTIGTYYSQKSNTLIKFSIEDKSTWNNVLSYNFDVLIWAASPSPGTENLEDFLNKQTETKFIYVSSDITTCPAALISKTSIGAYARQKLDEEQLVLSHPKSTVFITGPIYGKNSSGTLDKRSGKVSHYSKSPVEFWNNVYKTFVPVKGLAKTILDNLDKNGRFFIGPNNQQSFFDFYVSRANELGYEAAKFIPSEITKHNLQNLGQCQNISYAHSPYRLWSEC